MKTPYVGKAILLDYSISQGAGLFFIYIREVVFLAATTSSKSKKGDGSSIVFVVLAVLLVLMLWGHVDPESYDEKAFLNVGDKKIGLHRGEAD